MRFINLFRTTTQQKLTAGTTVSTIKLASLPSSVTAGALLISNAGFASPFEIVSFTGVDAINGTITGVTRGLKQDAASSTDNSSSLMLTWSRGSSAILIVPNYDLNDFVKASDDATFSDDVTVGGNLLFTGTSKVGVVLRSLTTAQRDVATPSNGALIFNTTAGELQAYLAGSWYTLSSGSTQPNASTTVAGKVEQSTLAEGKSGAATGGTGAIIVLTPADIQAILQSQESVSGTTAGTSTAYTLTLTPALSGYTTGQRFLVKIHTSCGNSPTININGLGAKSIVKNVSTALVTGDLETDKYYLMVYNGTNFVRINFTLVRPEELSGVSANVTATNLNTLTGGSEGGALHYHDVKFGSAGGNSSTTQTIAHGLGRTPKIVRINAGYADNVGDSLVSTSRGISNGTSHHCIATASDGTSGSQAGRYSDKVIKIILENGTLVNDATAALDGTNITLTWNNSTNAAIEFTWEVS